MLIWNTWCISAFSYVWNFFATPIGIQALLDKLCIQWLGHANTMRALYLSRPTRLAGLTSPLRDSTLACYSRLASLSYETESNPESPDWSMRISTHRSRAREFIVSEYEVDLSKKPDSATLYSAINTSDTMLANYHSYLDSRLECIGVDRFHRDIFYSNYEKVPCWLPSYARETTIRIMHNALFTARRLHKVEPCYLCGAFTDDMQHIWTNCPTRSFGHHLDARVYSASPLPSLRTGTATRRPMRHR